MFLPYVFVRPNEIRILCRAIVRGKARQFKLNRTGAAYDFRMRPGSPAQPAKKTRARREPGLHRNQWLSAVHTISRSCGLRFTPGWTVATGMADAVDPSALK